jgi:hypothetical protein
VVGLTLGYQCLPRARWRALLHGRRYRRTARGRLGGDPPGAAGPEVVFAVHGDSTKKH